jgi:hypothetical protein
MTATDLYEIVRDVPREAWPEQFDWYECGGDTPYRCFTVNGEEYNYKNNLLEVAFVGSMTAWLVSQGYHNFEYRVDDDNSVLVLEYGRTEVAVPLAKRRDSMVDALAAACKEVGNDG